MDAERWPGQAGPSPQLPQVPPNRGRERSPGHAPSRSRFGFCDPTPQPRAEPLLTARVLLGHAPSGTRAPPCPLLPGAPHGFTVPRSCHPACPRADALSLLHTKPLHLAPAGPPRRLCRDPRSEPPGARPSAAIRLPGQHPRGSPCCRRCRTFLLFKAEPSLRVCLAHVTYPTPGRRPSGQFAPSGFCEQRCPARPWLRWRGPPCSCPGHRAGLCAASGRAAGAALLGHPAGAHRLLALTPSQRPSQPTVRSHRRVGVTRLHVALIGSPPTNWRCRASLRRLLLEKHPCKYFAHFKSSCLVVVDL